MIEKVLGKIKNRKIMIVDDEPFNRMSIKNLLELVGIDISSNICIEAEDGQQAFELVKKNALENRYEFINIDLILMDFQMPILDGN